MYSLNNNRLLQQQNLSSNLIYPHVWVWRYDSSTREIHSLPRKVTTETTLFAFEPLNKSSSHFLWLELNHKKCKHSYGFILSSNLFTIMFIDIEHSLNNELNCTK